MALWSFREQSDQILSYLWKYIKWKKERKSCVYSLLNFLISGMKVAYKMFPEGLMTGTPPPVVTETPRPPSEMHMAQKGHFDQSDLDNLNIYLDSQLMDKSSGSKYRINPFLPSGLVHPCPISCQLDKSISSFRGVWCTFSFLLAHLSRRLIV